VDQEFWVGVFQDLIAHFPNLEILKISEIDERSCKLWIWTEEQCEREFYKVTQEPPFFWFS
jgi:hypothetical protein